MKNITEYVWNIILLVGCCLVVFGCVERSYALNAHVYFFSESYSRVEVRSDDRRKETVDVDYIDKIALFKGCHLGIAFYFDLHDLVLTSEVVQQILGLVEGSVFFGLVLEQCEISESDIKKIVDILESGSVPYRFVILDKGQIIVEKFSPYDDQLHIIGDIVRYAIAAHPSVEQSNLLKDVAEQKKLKNLVQDEWQSEQNERPKLNLCLRESQLKQEAACRRQYMKQQVVGGLVREDESRQRLELLQQEQRLRVLAKSGLISSRIQVEHVPDKQMERCQQVVRYKDNNVGEPIVNRGRVLPKSSMPASQEVVPIVVLPVKPWQHAAGTLQFLLADGCGITLVND